MYMFAYVITRETASAYDTKIVFDDRNLIEDIESCNEVARNLWPGDPKNNNSIKYYATSLPCDTIIPTIKIHQDESGTVWMWETVWSTFDYKDNIVEGIFEFGYNEDYKKCFQEAYESYNCMIQKD